MKLQKTLVGLLLGVTLGFTGVVAPIPGNHEVASAQWTQSRADKVISIGKSYWGTPYKFGSSSSTTRTFDCSSFTKRVFSQVGVYLPRVSRDQAKRGYRVAKSNIRKGDLIFFRSSGSSTYSKYITHVAIYAGNNKILHTYGRPGVTTSTFRGTSWEKRFVTARRVL